MDQLSFMQPLKPKLPAALQLSANLAAYISAAYDQDPKTYMSELKELESLRESAINAPLSSVPDPSSIPCLVKYIKELRVLPSRFPVDEDNIKLAIGWYNAMPADKGTKPLAFFSLQYEHDCVMFNLAVLLGKLGNVEASVGSYGKQHDHLKKACNYYMQSAGTILEIYNNNNSNSNNNSSNNNGQIYPSNCDLNRPALKGLSEMMLGQAQECCYWKGLADGSKDGVLAKVALAAAELYFSAATSFGDIPVFTQSPEGRALISATGTKSGVFQIIAELKKCSELKSALKFSEELGRLAFIQETLVPKLSTFNDNRPSELTTVVKAIIALVNAEYSRAKKENQLIYHESAIPRSQQPAIVPFVMVKPSVHPELKDEPDYSGIFASLIPLRLHQAMTRYQRAKVERVNLITSDLEKVKSSINELIIKNNLSSSLEAIEQPIGLPESLFSKIRELEGHGGMSGMHASIELLRQMAHESNQLFCEIDRLLTEEIKEDEQYRAVFGAGWKRMKSRQAASAYFDKMDQFRAAMHTASDADAVISNRLVKYGRDLDILCSGSVESVAILIPASHPTNRLSAAARVAVDRLKGWLSQTNALVSDIDKIIGEVNAFSESDYPIKTMSNATSDAKINMIISNELDKFNKFNVKLVKDKAQSLIIGSDIIIKEFKSVMSESGTNSKERQSVLQRLDDAYKHYLLINKDLSDGIKFYSSIQDPLMRMKNDVADYVTSRAVEAEELAAELQRSQSPLRSPAAAFPAAAAPREPWPINSSTPTNAYPSSSSPSTANKYTWMPGMPINYARK